MPIDASEDFNVWQSFKSGSVDAFQKIYDDQFTALFDYGARLCSDREMVKDAIHDLFVKLWNNRKNLADVSALRSYLLVSLRGSIYNRIAREKKIVAGEVGDGLPFGIVFSAEHEMIQKETERLKIQKVIDGLNTLSPRQKEILYLKYYQELSYETVAEVLQISVKATYKLNARALEALRTFMGTAFAVPLLLIIFNLTSYRTSALP